MCIIVISIATDDSKRLSCNACTCEIFIISNGSLNRTAIPNEVGNKTVTLRIEMSKNSVCNWHKCSLFVRSSFSKIKYYLANAYLRYAPLKLHKIERFLV